MSKIYVYLPCYNEAENIGALTESWVSEAAGLQAQGYQLEIVPIDDKSTDNTLSIIHSLEEKHPEVRVVAHAENQNLGGVLNTAVLDFLSHAASADLMCVMDGDNTHKPQYIYAMLAALQTPVGCVIASRYQQGAKTVGVPPVRLLLSDCARLYYSLLLCVPHVRDYTCGYRLYTRRALERAYRQYGENLITMRTFSCMMELLFKLHKTGCQFAEVPFTLCYDEKEGASKMRVGRTVRDSLVTALRLRVTL